MGLGPGISGTVRVWGQWLKQPLKPSGLGQGSGCALPREGSFPAHLGAVGSLWLRRTWSVSMVCTGFTGLGHYSWRGLWSLAGIWYGMVWGSSLWEQKRENMGGFQPNGVARHGLVQLGEEKAPERPHCGLPVLEVSV